MATATETRKDRTIGIAGVELPSVEMPSLQPAQIQAKADRFQVLSRQVIEANKAIGLISLNAFESGVQELIDMEHKVAEAYENEWLSKMTQAHAALMTDLSGTYVKAAREILK